MTRAVIYTRVSSEEQTKNLSLDVQEKSCRDFCTRSGWAVEKVYREEGESAKTADRTRLKELLKDLRLRPGLVEYVVVYDTSRFARDVYVHTSLKQLLMGLGVKLRASTQPIEDTAAGRAIEGVFAVFNQLDNELRAEKVTAGMRETAARGGWPWAAPLGYQNDRTPDGRKCVAIDPERGRLMRKGFELVRDGVNPAEALRRLTALGLRGKTGRVVRRQEFHKFLRNPFFKGTVSSPGFGIEVPGKHEALVDPSTWESVQIQLAGGARPDLVSRTRANPEFPLRGFIRCDHCGKPLTGALSRGKMGLRYGYYFCWGKGCRKVNIRTERLEDLFGALLRSVQLEPAMMRLLEAALRDTWQDLRRDSTQEVAAIRRRITELEKRKELLVEAYIYRQAVDRATYDAQKSALDEALDQLRAGWNSLLSWLREVQAWGQAAGAVE
jgi:DNA invertase Pin-like site-specific DNA recombinase